MRANQIKDLATLDLGLSLQGANEETRIKGLGGWLLGRTCLLEEDN